VQGSEFQYHQKKKKKMKKKEFNLSMHGKAIGWRQRRETRKGKKSIEVSTMEPSPLLPFTTGKESLPESFTPQHSWLASP
jgi:hypothetical protein